MSAETTKPSVASTRAAEQEQFLTVLSREEALARFEAALFPRELQSQDRALGDALGLALAQDVVAAVDVPPFDRSNVDGFAVRSADLAAAGEAAVVRLSLNGETIACGTAPRLPVTAGTATPIATGGPLPRGADAVVMVEHSEIAGDNAVDIRRAAAPGQFVSYAGSDIARGEVLLRAGTVIGSREIGMLAASGIARVSVVRKPRVAVISTGDELVQPGEALRPAAIYDTNGAIVTAAIAENGGEASFLGAFPDDEAVLDKIIREALQDFDMVVMSGGTSKGEGDVCHRIVARLGQPGIVAHGIALKPGKPLCLAVCDGKPVIILPGFPTSAMFTFHDMIVPVLRRLAGLPPRADAQVAAKVPVRVTSEVGRAEFVMVSLVEGEGGLIAYPSGKGSGAITSFAQADGFLRIDALADQMPAGTETDVTLFTPHVRAPDLVIVGSHCTGLDIVGSELARAGLVGAFDRGRQPWRTRSRPPRRMRSRADPSAGRGVRKLQHAVPQRGSRTRARLAAHAGNCVSQGRCALRRPDRRASRAGGAENSLVPDGQPQPGRRHAHSDRPPARRRAAGRLLESAALAQRGRSRRGAASGRLGHDHRAGRGREWAGLHSRSRKNTTTSRW